MLFAAGWVGRMGEGFLKMGGTPGKGPSISPVSPTWRDNPYPDPLTGDAPRDHGAAA